MLNLGCIVLDKLNSNLQNNFDALSHHTSEFLFRLNIYIADTNDVMTMPMNFMTSKNIFLCNVMIELRMDTFFKIVEINFP